MRIGREFNIVSHFLPTSFIIGSSIMPNKSWLGPDQSILKYGYLFNLIFLKV